LPHDPKDENLEIILGQSQDIAVNTSDSRHHQLQPVFFIGSNHQPIYIHYTVWEHLWNYAQDNQNREVGGVLVGESVLDSGVSVLEITGFIEGRYMKESFTTLTFTHETWNDINKRLEQDYPYKKIVGWFHTHPGHGIFLSRYDTFIHQNFFPGKEQVAVVFDPLRKKCGFFVWEDKQIVRNYNVFIFAYGNENFQGEINNLPYTAQDNLDNMETKSYIDIDVDLSDPVEGKPRGKPFHEILSPLIEEQSFEPKAPATPTETEPSSQQEASTPLAPDHAALDTDHLESSSVNPELTFEFSSETSLNQGTVLSESDNGRKKKYQLAQKSYLAASKLKPNEPDKT